MKQDRSGTTLMEVLVICLILFTLGTFAVYGFTAALPEHRLKAAARELHNNLHRIKMMAIKENTQHTITYSSAPDQYHLSGISRTVTLGDYGGGIRFLGPQGQTFAATTITFNSRGTCNAGYAYITDARNTAFYRVGPLSTGIVRLQKHVSGDSWE